MSELPAFSWHAPRTYWFRKQAKLVWLICFPCITNTIGLLLRKSHALENKRARKPFWESSTSRNKILPISKRRSPGCFVRSCHASQAPKNVFLEMKQEKFSGRSLQLCVVSSIIVFVPKAKTKNPRSFEKSRSDRAYWGWEKWQTTNQTRLPKFPVLVFSPARGTSLTMQLSGRAEGRISDALSNATQTPSPNTLQSPQFCFEQHFRRQELKNAARAYSNLEVLQIRTREDTTTATPSLLFGQKQAPRCFCDVKTCFILFQPSLKTIKITPTKARRSL